MKIHRINTYDEYVQYNEKNKDIQKKHNDFLLNETPLKKQEFTIKGYSYPAKKEVNFVVDYEYGDGKNINWRERVVCPETKLNNRVRAAIHLLDIECEPQAKDNIYITEQVTPAYIYFKKKFPNIIGSEFLGDEVKAGKIIEEVRHEDVTKLSFRSNKFDHVLSFDVFEHVPNYLNGFKEVFRVLKPKGVFIFSVPFNRNFRKNLVRAKIQNGKLIHLCEPEYHGDPFAKSGGGGILCYYHFGWEMLDKLREIGFSNVYACVFNNIEFGYLGDEHIFFVAHKESNGKTFFRAITKALKIFYKKESSMDIQELKAGDITSYSL